MDLLDLALGISIADPWTFEDRLDTVAGAILGARPGRTVTSTCCRNISARSDARRPNCVV